MRGGGGGSFCAVVMMDEEEQVMLLTQILYRRRQCRRRRDKRTMWMHKITSSRLAIGQYNTLIDILRADTAAFENYFRMSQQIWAQTTIVKSLHFITTLGKHIL